MNNLGHLTATGLLAQELPRRYRFFLKLGSLLPDLLVFTYVGGHNWDSTRDKTARALWEMGFRLPDSQANFLFVTHPRIDGARLYQK